MGADAFTYISSMPHFSFRPDDERHQIAKSAKVVRYSAGTIFAKQGQSEIDAIFIPVEGSLALYVESDTDRTLSGYIRPGDVFGGISILLNGATFSQIG